MFYLTNSLPNLVPLMQSEVFVVVDRDLPDSLTLRYTPTPILSSRFDLYRFRISDTINTTKEKALTDADTKVTFSGLIPGRLYNVTMWTVSDNVESRPLFRYDRLCKLNKNQRKINLIIIMKINLDFIFLIFVIIFSFYFLASIILLYCFYISSYVTLHSEKDLTLKIAFDMTISGKKDLMNFPRKVSFTFKCHVFLFCL